MEFHIEPPYYLIYEQSGNKIAGWSNSWLLRYNT